jgi:hypothetical protein
LAGCSKNEVAYQEPSGALIQAGAAFSGVSGEATRVPYTADKISATNPLDARVLTSKTSGDYSNSNRRASGQMIFEGSGPVGYESPASGFDGNPYFEKGDAVPYYLVGLYPYTSWEGDKLSTTVPTTISTGLTGNIDLMAAAQKQTTYKETITDGKAPELEFKHLLTKLDVKVKGSENFSQYKWGKVRNIELLTIDDKTPANTVAVTLETGSSVFRTEQNPPTPVAFYSIDEAGKYTDKKFENAEIVLTQQAQPVAYILIAPYENPDGTTPLKFRIETESGGTVTSELALPKTEKSSTQGYYYNITFAFDADGDNIRSTAKVEPWGYGGDAQGDVQ